MTLELQVLARDMHRHVPLRGGVKPVKGSPTPSLYLNIQGKDIYINKR
jgi:hypothetical protein